MTRETVMAEEELAAHADASYFDWWRVWASSVEGGEVREEDGLLVAATGAPQAWWNIAIVTRPLSDPDENIRKTIAFFDERRQPFILRVREGVDPASESAAEANGFPYSDTIPGLALHPIPSVEGRGSALEIRTVADAEALEQSVQVGAHAFHMPLDDVRKLSPMRQIEHPRWRSYVGYAEGRPVATSALLITGEVAGIYWVATEEEFRGRGYGEAVTWHAIREGVAAGCRVAALQASTMGRPVYERMGFRLVAGYRTFVRSEPADD